MAYVKATLESLPGNDGFATAYFDSRAVIAEGRPDEQGEFKRQVTLPVVVEHRHIAFAVRVWTVDFEGRWTSVRSGVTTCDT